jgi:SAM-dependent methyltransferase
MSSKPGLYELMLERYESGETPWDSGTIPPELHDQADKMQPGRALDLGCGYGRASIFLAKLGWRVEAIDFVPLAIAEAKDRATAAGVSSQINFHLGSVGDLSFLHGKFDFALDIGCMHNLPESELPGYRNGLLRLLRQGAIYLLFFRLRRETDEEAGEIRGVSEEAINALFREGFELERAEYGVSQVEDHPAWASAWFWLRRQGL